MERKEKKAVDWVYKFIYYPTRHFSGDGGDVFGTITRVSIDKMVSWLIAETSFSNDDVFLDGGCAYNVVACQVAQLVNCRAWGIEYVKDRVTQATHAFLQGIGNGEVDMLNTSVAYVPMDLHHFQHFGNTTHGFFFDEAFPEHLYRHCVKTAAKTASLKYFMTFKPSKRRSLHLIPEQLGFKRISELKVNKAGGENNTLYLYEKIAQIALVPQEKACFSEILKTCWYGTLEEKIALYTNIFETSCMIAEKDKRERKTRAKKSSLSLYKGGENTITFEKLPPIFMIEQNSSIEN